MLNPFPELLTFSLAAPAIIRLFLGLYFVAAGAKLFKELYREKRAVGEPSVVEPSPENDVPEETAADEKKRRRSPADHVVWLLAFAGSGAVLAGFLTQIGALVLGAVSLYFVYRNPDERSAYLLLFAMSLSLLFSGAGFFAFDLPL